MSLYKWLGEKNKEDDGSDRCTMTQVKWAYFTGRLLCRCGKSIFTFYAIEHCAVDCGVSLCFVGDVSFSFSWKDSPSIYYYVYYRSRSRYIEIRTERRNNGISLLYPTTGWLAGLSIACFLFAPVNVHVYQQLLLVQLGSSSVVTALLYIKS